MAIPASSSPLAAAAFGTTPSSSGTSPSSFGSPREGFNRPAPYMVALAGWPEPVFVPEARETWEKKRSRPPSPVGFRDVRDGICSPNFRDLSIRDNGARLPPLDGGFRDGVSVDKGTQQPPNNSMNPNPSVYAAPRGVGMSRTASGNVPIDPALRSGPSSPLRSSVSPDASPPRTAVSHSRTGSSSSQHQQQQQQFIRRKVQGFVDPRYHPNAPVLGGRRVALRVAPAWVTGSSGGAHGGHTPSNPHGGHAHAHPHHASAPYAHPPPRARPGVLVTPQIQRSTPEVWPPPKAHMGLVTELYPRDPDSPWMWKTPSASGGASGVTSPHQSLNHSANVSNNHSTTHSSSHSASHSATHSASQSVSHSRRASPVPTPTPRLEETVKETKEEKEMDVDE